MIVRRTTVLTLFIICAAVLGHACGSSSPTTSSAGSGPYRVGVPFGYTGRHLPIGQTWLDAVQVAGQNIIAAGGVMGRNPIALAIETSADPVDAVPAIRQMLAVDNVSGVVGLSGTDWQNVVPILNTSKMVSFTHIGDPSIDNLTDPYIFSTAPSDAVLGAAMVEYANSQGYKRPALIFDAAEGAQTVVPSVKHAAAALNMQVVADPALPENAPSYEAAVIQVLAAKPDVLLLQLDPQGAGTFFHELKQLGGTNIPVIGTDYTADPNWVKAIGASLDNAEVTSILAGNGISGPGAKDYLPLFQSMFHFAPSYVGASAYDGMTVMALAMEDCKSMDPTVYVKCVLDVTTPGSSVTVVYNFADGKKLLDQGKKIKYFGVATPMTFNKYHRVTGDYIAQKFNADGTTTTKVGDIPGTSLVPLI